MHEIFLLPDTKFMGGFSGSLCDYYLSPVWESLRRVWIWYFPFSILLLALTTYRPTPCKKKYFFCTAFIFMATSNQLVVLCFWNGIWALQNIWTHIVESATDLWEGQMWPLCDLLVHSGQVTFSGHLSVDNRVTPLNDGDHVLEPKPLTPRPVRLQCSHVV